ncbi:small secreted hydrophilic protein [Streptomyces djakartensis]|uniref:small secreted hydrophilic protein n=1 Tax=Streptomyces djakartensis TaxID=68193 RepID=UPI0034DDED75
MAFSRRMAALSAVVLIPLGIAATSYALADGPRSPAVPSQQVELDRSPSPPTPAPPSTRDPAPTTTPSREPGDEVVSRPPVTDSPASDDDDDDGGRGSGDDGPGDDDGPGSDT